MVSYGMGYHTMGVGGNPEPWRSPAPPPCGPPCRAAARGAPPPPCGLWNVAWLSCDRQGLRERRGVRLLAASFAVLSPRPAVGLRMLLVIITPNPCQTLANVLVSTARKLRDRECCLSSSLQTLANVPLSTAKKLRDRECCSSSSLQTLANVLVNTQKKLFAIR